MDKKLNGYIMSGDIKVVKVENSIPKIMNENLCPLYFKYNIDFNEWLSSRAIDSHRTNSRLLKKMLRLQEKDDVSTTLEAHAVTITDNYWFKYEGEILTWEDVRFKENLFSEIALNGSLNNIDFDSNKINSHTPELTNIGSYEKCWKLNKNRWYLWKKESKEEMFSELFTYNLGKQLGFNMAEYEYDTDYIKSPDFTDGNKVNFESFYSIVKDNEDYSKSFNYLNSLSNKEIAKDYLKMIYLDSICYNVDRHTKNYGVLRNKETGEIISLSPNYDNNISLIARGRVNDITRQKDGLLKFFYEFIEENAGVAEIFLQLDIPKITKDMIIASINNTKIEIEDDTKEYIIEFILNGQERIYEFLL